MIGYISEKLSTCIINCTRDLYYSQWWNYFHVIAHFNLPSVSKYVENSKLVDHCVSQMCTTARNEITWMHMLLCWAYGFELFWRNVTSNWMKWCGIRIKHGFKLELNCCYYDNLSLYSTPIPNVGSCGDIGILLMYFGFTSSSAKTQLCNDGT